MTESTVSTSYDFPLTTADLVPMVVGDLLVLPLRPLVQHTKEDDRRAGITGELEELLVELSVAVFEHGRDDLLFEGR